MRKEVRKGHTVGGSGFVGMGVPPVGVEWEDWEGGSCVEE